jgi:hypothetical protein
MQTKLSETGNDNLPFSAAFDSGVFINYGLDLVPVWQDCRNVYFRNGAVEKIPGWANFDHTTAAAPIRGMLEQHEAGVQELFFGDQTKLYKWIISISDVGTGYTGNLDESVVNSVSIWSFADWGTWVAATNNKDVPQIYKGSSFAALDVDSQFTTAKIFMKSGPHVIALNTSVGGNWYHWCHADDIEDWLPTVSNTAGNLVIRDMESDIVAAAKLGKHIAAYGKKSMSIIVYSGYPFHFGHQPGLESVSVYGQNAVIAAGNLNFGFGLDGIWRTDGATLSYIDSPIHDFIFDDINKLQATKICGFHNEKYNTIEFYYPTAGSDEPDRGVVYNYKNGTWTVLDHGFTSALARKVYNYPMVATSVGVLVAVNNGLDADGSAMTAYAETKPLSFGTSEYYKYIDHVRLVLRRLAGTVTFKVGVKEELDGATTWVVTSTIDDGAEPLWANISGRYIIFRIESTTLGADWAVEGQKTYGSPKDAYI